MDWEAYQRLVRRACFYLDIPDRAQADLATRLRLRMTSDPAAGS